MKSTKARKMEQVKIDQINKLEAIETTVRRASKAQQQSLILLEEVDILFKDDKDFWSSVFRLMAHSKRPFILTCNDEDLVPLHAMTLHAILRLVPPPLDLATDYLVLLSAAEGHLLEREAVRLLYQLKGSDLRASIMHLDFWCQMGIGDPRGGLSWIFQRWPPDSDLDEHGRRLRVASKGTYKPFMGLIPEPDLSSVEAVSWACCESSTEPSDVFGWDNITYQPDFDQPNDKVPTAIERRSILFEMGRMADALSASDTYASTGSHIEACLDPSQPEISDKARGQYTEGLQLLQTDERIEYSSLSHELLNLSTMLTYRTTGLWSSGDKRGEEQINAGILRNRTKTIESSRLTRQDFACFDPISAPLESAILGVPFMTPSVFDGPIANVVLDLAPYVRSIAQFDKSLEEERYLLDRLTVDGRSAKRARTTRAARSALYGSQRATTRRERWFTKNLDLDAVLATAGSNWPRIVPALMEGSSGHGTDVPPSSAESAETL